MHHGTISQIDIKILSRITANRKGLSIDPWCKLTPTGKDFDNPNRCLYVGWCSIIHVLYNFNMALWDFLSLQACPDGTSRYAIISLLQIYKHHLQIFFLSLYFLISLLSTCIALVVDLPSMKQNWCSLIHASCVILFSIILYRYLKNLNQISLFKIKYSKLEKH